MANDPNETIEVDIKAKDETAPVFKTAKEAALAYKAVQVQIAQATLRSKTADDVLKQSKYQLKAITDTTKLSLMAQKLALQAAAAAERKLAREINDGFKAQKLAQDAQKAATKTTDNQGEETKKASAEVGGFKKKLAELSETAGKRVASSLQSMAARVGQLSVSMAKMPFSSARRGFNEVEQASAAGATRIESFVKGMLRLADVTPLLRSVGSAMGSMFGKLSNLPQFAAGGLESGLSRLGSAFQGVASAGIRSFTSALGAAGTTTQSVVSAGLKPLELSIRGVDTIAQKTASVGLHVLAAGVTALSATARTAVSALGGLVSIVSNLPNPVKIATGALGGMLDYLGKIGLAANGIKTLESVFQNLSGALTRGNADLEMTTVSMDTLLGSTAATQKLLKQLSQLAMVSPFGVKQLQDTAKSLLSMKFDAAQVVPLLTAVGNAVAAMGTGNEGINRITLALEQMQAKGRVQGDELMQLMEAGLPALQMLAAGFGVTTVQMQKMVEQGVVPADKAIAVLTDQMNKRYPDMMRVQSTTFNGMLSNLHDWAYQTTLTLTKPFFEPAKRALKAFLDYVTSPAGQAAVEKLAGFIQRGVDKMTAAFDRLEPKIKPFLENLLTSARLLISQYGYVASHIIPTLEVLINKVGGLSLALLRLHAVLSPVGIAFSVLNGFLKDGVAGGIAAFQKRFLELQTYVNNGINLAVIALNKYGPGILRWVEETGSKLAKKALDWGEAFVSWVAPVLARLISQLEVLAEKVISWIIQKAPVLLAKLESWATAFLDWLVPLAGRLTRKLLNLLTVVLNWVTAHADEILNKLESWAETLVSWVLPMIPDLLEALGGVLNKVILWVVTSGPRILTALLKWLDAFIDWIKPMIGQIFFNLRLLIDTLLRWVAQNAPKIVNALLDWALAFLRWIDPLIPVLINALARILSSILNWVIEHAADVLNIVLSWIDAFLTAFDSLLPQILAALRVVITAILKWIFERGPDILAMLLNWGVQFLDWALGLFDAMKPNLETFINRVLQWLVAKGPSLLDKMWGWIQNGLNIVSQLFNYITPVLMELVRMLGNWVTTHATQILNQFWGWLSQGIDIASEFLRNIAPYLQRLADKIIGWFNDHAQEILDKLWGFLSGIIDIATLFLKHVAPKLEQLAGKITDWFTAHSDEILDKLWNFLSGTIDISLLFLRYLEPKLAELSGRILGWLEKHSDEILNKLWEWLSGAVDIAFLFAKYVEPKLDSLVGMVTVHLAEKANDIISDFLGSLVKELFNNQDGYKGLGQTIAGFILEGVMKNPITNGIVHSITIKNDNGSTFDLGVLWDYLFDKVTGKENANTPKKAMGDSSFKGGSVLWGEAGWERMTLPGGLNMYAAGPVYMPDAPAGSKFTPARDMGAAGGEVHIHNHLTINGNPDRAMLAEIDRRIEKGVSAALSKVKAGAANSRAVNRTRG